MKRFSLNVWRKNEPDQLPSPIREVGAHRQHRRPNLRPNGRKSPTPSTAKSPDPSSRPFVTSSTASSFRPRSRRRTSSRVRWPRACWSSFQSLEEETSRGLPVGSGTDAGSASTGRQGASGLGRRNQEPKLLENDRSMRLDRWIPKRRPEIWYHHLGKFRLTAGIMAGSWHFEKFHCYHLLLFLLITFYAAQCISNLTSK